MGSTLNSLILEVVSLRREQIYRIPHLNLLTSHSITFAVGVSIKYGPNKERQASIDWSSSALASDERSVLSIDFAWSENNLSSNGRKAGSRDANCKRPLIPKACMA